MPCENVRCEPSNIKHQSYPELLVLEKLREELTSAISEIIKVRRDPGEINFALYYIRISGVYRACVNTTIYCLSFH